MFNYPRVFQHDNGSEYKSEMTKLREKQKADVRRATTNHKHTHAAFPKAFGKELAKQLPKPTNGKNLQDPEKVLAILIKNLNSIVNKINSTKSSMVDMKPKVAIELDYVKLDKCETCPKELVLSEDIH